MMEGKANMLLGDNEMSKRYTSTKSSSSPQASTTLTAANLDAHQRGMAVTSSNTSSQGKLLSNGEVSRRHAAPDPDSWQRLTERDSLAADIEDALRAASKAKKDKGN